MHFLCIKFSYCFIFYSNFSVFILFYGFKFFLEFKLSKIFFNLFICNNFSITSYFFLIWKDFYLFKNEVYDIHFAQKFNLSNKIIIISSFIFLFFFPFFKKLNILIVNNKKIYILKYYFINFNIYFISFLFDFKSGAGVEFFTIFQIFYLKIIFFYILYF